MTYRQEQRQMIGYKYLTTLNTLFCPSQPLFFLREKFLCLLYVHPSLSQKLLKLCALFRVCAFIIQTPRAFASTS